MERSTYISGPNILFKFQAELKIALEAMNFIVFIDSNMIYHTWFEVIYFAYNFNLHPRNKVELSF